MDTVDEIDRKQQLLGDYARRWRFKLRRHDARVSHLEGIMGRGDVRTGDLIERAWCLGARFDGWDEHLAWDIWEQALAEREREHQLSRGDILGTLPLDGRLPWAKGAQKSAANHRQPNWLRQCLQFSQIPGTFPDIWGQQRM